MITQAISDFLATEAKTPLDGILYPSVQSDSTGLNAVLFHKSARCKELTFTDGTEFDAHTHVSTEDGPEPGYSVVEWVIPEENSPRDADPLSAFDLAPLVMLNFSEFDDRRETLSLDVNSIRVHTVNAVRIRTDSFDVRRYRHDKTISDF